MSTDRRPIDELISEHNSVIDPAATRIGILLAGGHGKRIRSETSKMLHEIWGRPSALRVADLVVNSAIHEARLAPAGQLATDESPALMPGA